MSSKPTAFNAKAVHICGTIHKLTVRKNDIVNERDSKTCQESLAALCVLSRKATVKHVILRAVAQPLLQVFQKYHLYEATIQSACDLVWSLAYHDQDVQGAFASNGICSAVIECAKDNAENVNILKSSYGALSSLCRHPVNQGVAKEANVINLLMDTLSREGFNDPVLLQYALDATASVCHAHKENGNTFINSGGVGFVTKALSKNPATPTIVRSACIVLVVLRDRSQGSQVIVSNNAIPALIKTIRLHIQVPDLEHILCALLGQLMRENPTVASRVIVNDGIPAVLQCMEVNPKHYFIVEAVCMVLSGCCSAYLKGETETITASVDLAETLTTYNWSALFKVISQSVSRTSKPSMLLSCFKTLTQFCRVSKAKATKKLISGDVFCRLLSLAEELDTSLIPQYMVTLENILTCTSAHVVANCIDAWIGCWLSNMSTPVASSLICFSVVEILEHDKQPFMELNKSHSDTITITEMQVLVRGALKRLQQMDRLKKDGRHKKDGQIYLQIRALFSFLTYSLLRREERTGGAGTLLVERDSVWTDSIGTCLAWLRELRHMKDFISLEFINSSNILDKTSSVRSNHRNVMCLHIITSLLRFLVATLYKERQLTLRSMASNGGVTLILQLQKEIKSLTFSPEEKSPTERKLELIRSNALDGAASILRLIGAGKTPQVPRRPTDSILLHGFNEISSGIKQQNLLKAVVPNRETTMKTVATLCEENEEEVVSPRAVDDIPIDDDIIAEDDVEDSHSESTEEKSSDCEEDRENSDSEEAKDEGSPEEEKQQEGKHEEVEEKVMDLRNSRTRTIVEDILTNNNDSEEEDDDESDNNDDSDADESEEDESVIKEIVKRTVEEETKSSTSTAAPDVIQEKRQPSPAPSKPQQTQSNPHQCKTTILHPSSNANAHFVAQLPELIHDQQDKTEPYIPTNKRLDPASAMALARLAEYNQQHRRLVYDWHQFHGEGDGRAKSSIIPGTPYSVGCTVPLQAMSEKSILFQDIPRPLSSANDHYLKFDSRFESANLLQAVRIGPREYDLIVRSDLHTRSHHQWFYFAVSNTHSKNVSGPVEYKFNIPNMTKPSSMFSQGMKPVLYSMQDAKTKGQGWRRSGANIAYFANSYQPPGNSSKKNSNYYTLTFSITFENPSDTYLVAMCYPYTYTKLQRYLEAKCTNTDIVRRSLLCNTLGGLRCDVVTITDFKSSSKELASRPAVVFSGRVHPGEVVASYMMEGTMEFLLGDSALAKLVRRLYVFKIVPMLNPDGVYHGNSRTSLSACDLNRTWINPEPHAFPTIWHTKQLIKQLLASRKVSLYVDFHGHSRKKNIFMYGVEYKGSKSRSLNNDPTYFNPVRQYPKLVAESSATSAIFSLPDCSFTVSRSHSQAARVVVARELGVRASFTLEASFCGAGPGTLDNSLNEVHFNAKHYKQIGVGLVDALLKMYHPKVLSRLEELEIKYTQDTITNQMLAQILNAQNHPTSGSSSTMKEKKLRIKKSLNSEIGRKSSPTKKAPLPSRSVIPPISKNLGKSRKLVKTSNIDPDPSSLRCSEARSTPIKPSKIRRSSSSSSTQPLRPSTSGLLNADPATSSTSKGLLRSLERKEIDFDASVTSSSPQTRRQFPKSGKTNKRSKGVSLSRQFSTPSLYDGPTGNAQSSSRAKTALHLSRDVSLERFHSETMRTSPSAKALLSSSSASGGNKSLSPTRKTSRKKKKKSTSVLQDDQTLPNVATSSGRFY